MIKKLFYLKLEIHLMYTFRILDIEGNKINFLEFLKYRLNSHGFNKSVIKSKKYKQSKNYFLMIFLCKTICRYNIFLKDLAICT